MDDTTLALLETSTWSGADNVVVESVRRRIERRREEEEKRENEEEKKDVYTGTLTCSH
jgi:uncharacterized protein (UPF0335 family)